MPGYSYTNSDLTNLLHSSVYCCCPLRFSTPNQSGRSGAARDATLSQILKGLAASWPQAGPRQLWTRPLGEGHSAIVVDGNTLYTMYSQGEQEAVIALAADTGKTFWEHKYDAPTAGMNYEAGAGPHSTPLLVGDLLYTVGSIGKAACVQTRKPERSSGLTISRKTTAGKRWIAATHAAPSPIKTRSS